jgi:lipid-binding SYLF domain-containing protein
LLQELVAGAVAGPYDKLNGAVLNSAEALAFINSTKGGLGLTLAHGYGFLIRKLDQDLYGNSRWSQPLFFTLNQGGFGLAAGEQLVRLVQAISASCASIRARLVR